jgi:hypothetical protein
MFRPFCLLILILLCGCSSSSDDLVGIWAGPKFRGTAAEWITFSPDGTALLQRERIADIQMTWKRLDQERFILTQSGGETWVGCESEGEINIRMPHGWGPRQVIRRYLRCGPKFWWAFRKERSFSQGLTCKP